MTGDVLLEELLDEARAERDQLKSILEQITDLGLQWNDRTIQNAEFAYKVTGLIPAEYVQAAKVRRYGEAT